METEKLGSIKYLEGLTCDRSADVEVQMSRLLFRSLE